MLIDCLQAINVVQLLYLPLKLYEDRQPGINIYLYRYRGRYKKCIVCHVLVEKLLILLLLKKRSGSRRSSTPSVCLRASRSMVSVNVTECGGSMFCV